MVRITINLRSKYLFFGLSGICFFLLIQSINITTMALDITSIHIVSYYGLITLTAAFFWVPYQFNEEFT